ncbi:hypothetical protein [Shouchella hunanensis]|uniref:Uncharacterized protein n=1 Tax=Shouchella hunanensis TaxID=766894 RepID=A0ABY7WA57_9BACI|nr:hypothetical protein [Shouchella hunanensis]WDF05792.1 hypothetical protein PQ477_10260 [Shouchella hunanensis]
MEVFAVSGHWVNYFILLLPYLLIGVLIGYFVEEPTVILLIVMALFWLMLLGWICIEKHKSTRTNQTK